MASQEQLIEFLAVLLVNGDADLQRISYWAQRMELTGDEERVLITRCCDIACGRSASRAL